MSNPTTNPAQGITPTVEVAFKLHLEHMDLSFSVADGKVQMAPGDFTQLLEVAKPKHAGLFGDTLKQVLELAGKSAEGEGVPRVASANRRMFDAVACVEELKVTLNKALDSVTGELARLVAMPPIFDDEDERKDSAPTASPPVPPQAPVATAEAVPAATPAAESPAAAPAPAADATAAAAPTTPSNT